MVATKQERGANPEARVEEGPSRGNELRRAPEGEAVGASRSGEEGVAGTQLHVKESARACSYYSTDTSRATGAAFNG